MQEKKLRYKKEGKERNDDVQKTLQGENDDGSKGVWGVDYITHMSK